MQHIRLSHSQQPSLFSIVSHRTKHVQLCDEYVVHWDVHELDDISDCTHDNEANAHGSRNFQEFVFIRLGTSVHELCPVP